MKKIILLLSIFMLVTLSACTSSIHMSQVDVDTISPDELNRGTIIEIEKSQKNILGFVYNTHYADQAYAELLQRCPSGTAIVNVEYLTNHGLLSWTDKIRIKAVCH